MRGYFNDPRISGSSRAFHFGIDISAPNGTPVHAVRGGIVHLEGTRSLSVADGDVDFGYWHIIPAVTYPGRLQQGAAAAGGLPTDLRARHLPEPSGKPRLYRFCLAHTWSTTALPDGSYHVEVGASNLRGNKGSLPGSPPRTTSSENAARVEMADATIPWHQPSLV